MNDFEIVSEEISDQFTEIQLVFNDKNGRSDGQSISLSKITTESKSYQIGQFRSYTREMIVILFGKFTIFCSFT
jgi:hypothetical protein